MRALRRAVRRIPLPGVIASVETEEPLVALTFDDGPDPLWTPLLLELLDRYQAKATFFMLGCAADRMPALVRRVSEAGHVIGNHTWDHPVLPRIPGRRVRSQTRHGQGALAPYGSRLFRPPYLAQSPASRLYALLLGYQVIMANVDSGDWWDPDADRITQRLIREVSRGDIVLLHDGLSGFSGLKLSKRPVPERVAMLMALDGFFQRKGGEFRFVTVPELLRNGRPRRVGKFSRGPTPRPSA